VPGAPICQECANQSIEDAIARNAQDEKFSGIAIRAREQYAEQDDAALERQQLNAGWEATSVNYNDNDSYDPYISSFEEPDEYEE
jgi:hypothetical protein